MTELVTFGEAPMRPIRRGKIVSTFDPQTEERFRNAAAAYRETCKARPSANRCKVAFMVGATTFKVTVETMQSKAKRSDISKVRQQLMAFSRVVSNGKRRNSWKEIAKCFHVTHASVIYAHKRYGAAIARIISED